MEEGREGGRERYLGPLGGSPQPLEGQLSEQDRRGLQVDSLMLTGHHYRPEGGVFHLKKGRERGKKS
jgi:hypothetical protein